MTSGVTGVASGVTGVASGFTGVASGVTGVTGVTSGVTSGVVSPSLLAFSPSVPSSIVLTKPRFPVFVKAHVAVGYTISPAALVLGPLALGYMAPAACWLKLMA